MEEAAEAGAELVAVVEEEVEVVRAFQLLTLVP